MAIPVLMPRQGQSVETCILGQWYKAVGEEVNEGDLLFSFETDKSAFEEEAKTGGILLAAFYEPGDEVPVLSNVAVIGRPGEAFDEFIPTGKNPSPVPQEQNLPSGKEEEKPKIIEFDVEEPGITGRVRISPLAKKMAEQMRVKIQDVKGTGPRGRIISRDIEKAAAQYNQTASIQQADSTYSSPSSKEVSNEDDFEIKAIPNIRKIIASAMYRSLQNSAQLTHHLSADARQLLRLRKKFKYRFSEGLTPYNVTINDLVCYAVVRALVIFPQVNTHYLTDKLKWFKKVHLGLAVDTERGLMVPALQNASDLSITELSYQLNLLARQARQGNINPDLLNPKAASFTVSNLGNYGVEMFTPVINLPQTAILGVCTISPRPQEIEEGVYGFVPVIGLSLTYNHQALDGGEATRFLTEIKTQIEKLDV
jgi:pyruvate dehydrogenase E2 component (dihydrolipoamide acetyltransferase)